MRRIAILLVAASLTGGCSMTKDEGAAEQAVSRFHHLLDAGQYGAIYDAAAPEMKTTTPRADFVRFMDAVHRKLGAVKQANRQDWRVNYTNGGSTVSLGYRTQFEHGSGIEQFVYRAGPSPALMGYDINSTALIVN